MSGDSAFALFEAEATGNLAPIARDRHLAQARDRHLAQARDRIQSALAVDGSIAAYCRDRSAALLEDHNRVRSALANTGPRVTVEPVLPADVIGLFVLIPGAN